jgi:hypothetical protein
MCDGATIDWIRRVLLGGKTEVSGNPFSNVDSEKKLKQNKKAAALQIHAGKRAQDEYFADFETRTRGLFDRKQDEIAEAIGHPPPEITTQAEYDSYVEGVQAEGRRWVRENYNPTITIENKWRQFWLAYCKKIGRRVGKKHHLSDLTIARSKPPTIYNNGLNGLIRAVLPSSVLNVNQAAKVGICSPTPSTTGHAIGIHRLNTGNMYHLFDPNLGVYDLTATNLVEAIRFLFLEAYPSCTEVTEGHVYEVDGKIMGDYVIFKKTETT